MKKFLQAICAASVLLSVPTISKAQRYLSEIFPSATVTSGVQYGSNITVLTSPPSMSNLLMDVYEPSGAADPLTQRPLVILLHTGSFLPPVINGQPTGSRTDSSLVEMCKRLARRGYVAAAASYRLGWNPAATGAAGQDIRTGTLLTAVYRGIQDAKACVRWFKADADTGSNTFGIDTTKIIMLGQGTGGYIAMAYATLDDPSEIALPKFLANTTDPNYGFVAGQPYVNQAVLGDYEGYGGIPQLNNPNNNPGHDTHIQFVVNLGGALGDTSWMAAGDAPFVAFHVVGDPFAPYGIGDVRVPTTGDFVVEVGGSQTALQFANNLGNNNCFANAGFTDPYTTYANTVNGGLEGLYPLYTNPALQAGPWEWFDSTATVFYASFLPPPYNTQGGAAYHNSILTNPDMSKAKAMAYIDTIMGYMNPRIVTCLGLVTGLDNDIAASAGVHLQPNPAADQMKVTVDNPSALIRSVEVTDIQGRRILYNENLDTHQYIIDRNGLPSGLYLVKLGFDNGSAVIKGMFR